MATMYPSIVNVLRTFWVLLTFWCEIGIFYHSAWRCEWPDSEFHKLQASTTQDEHPYHILLVADPQILDHRSYPGRPAFATHLSQLVADLNMRKNWRSAIRKEPDAVIFLGDMMDGGRFNMPDEEYEHYYARFKNIFPQSPDIPQLFIPGNHDIGLSTKAQSSTARYRYLSHFGDFNSAISVANHTLVLLDAPDIVEEDYKRSGAGASYKEWKPTPGGSVEFVHDFAAEDAMVKQEGKGDPVILFTHIPLYRPDGSSCGPLREKGTIRPGVGFGYQNTLTKETTQFILETMQPSVVFSGDDHDYCEYRHKYSPNGEGPVHVIREVSIKSMSMAMGIHRPGFQLLSLAPAELTARKAVPSTYADAPCFMPDQLGIYLRIYIPLLIISLLILFTSNVLVVRRSAALYSREEQRSSRFSTRRLHIRLEINAEDTNNSDLLLPTVRSPSKTRERPGALQKMVTSIFGCMRSCFSRRSGKREPPTILGGFLRDIRDVACFPIGLFVAITWFVTH